MAPVEVDHVPTSIVSVKSFKVVDKAMELPFLNSAYTEVTRIASPITPYVESTLSKVTPMVEASYQTIKTQVEEKVVPHIPDNITASVSTHMTATLESVTAAVEKVDNFACSGIDQLTEKVPQLKDATPKLIEETKVMPFIHSDVNDPSESLRVQGTVSTYVTTATDYTASFSIAQIALKFVDAGLDVVENICSKVGASEESLVVSNMKKLHTTANTIRISGVKKAGTETAKKVEEGSILEAFMFLFGIPELMAAFGIKLTKTETVYEDDVSKVVMLQSEETADPVVVDTAMI